VADLLFVVITIAFFALATGFVKICDNIIGPDTDHDLVGDEVPATLEDVAP
jgi:hypothetical protein